MIRFTLLLTLLLSLEGNAQPYEARLTARIPLIADRFFGVDQYGAIYFSKDQQLNKSLAREVWNFADLSLGQLTSLDISNPLTPVAFYKDSQVVIILDNRLSIIHQVDLKLLQPARLFGFVNLADNRQLWLYNTDLNRLELYDYTLDRVNAVTETSEEQAKALIAGFNFAYLAFPSLIIKYNSYGSRLAEWQVEDIRMMGIDDERVVAIGDRAWFKSEKEDTFSLLNIDLPLIKDLYLSGENLYLYEGENLYQYLLIIPK